MKHIASIFWFVLAAIIAGGAAQLLSLAPWPGLLRYLPTTVGIGVFVLIFGFGIGVGIAKQERPVPK